MLSDKITNWKNKIVRKIEDKAEHGQSKMNQKSIAKIHLFSKIVMHRYKMN